MKIAVFSDIHGNIFALEAVLKDIESHRPDIDCSMSEQPGGLQSFS